MNIRELIPKHKFDKAVIDRLKTLSFEQIEPIIPGYTTGYSFAK